MESAHLVSEPAQAAPEQAAAARIDANEGETPAGPSSAGSAPSQSRNLAGSTVQQYEVGDCLGEGGMGVVYRARDMRLDRTVALKFPSDGVKDAKNRERLLREARAASGLASPNIVSIYEVGEFDGAPFIAMEYIEGQRLSDRLEDGPLPLDEALDVITQVAGALDCAHAAGVIHRDIKSSNLVVMESGVVKVLDFGIAKLTAQDSSAPEPATTTLTVSGNIFGTLSYMSPEQALGKPVDHRSDLFSLGVVFYQALTGQLPFAGGNAVQLRGAARSRGCFAKAPGEGSEPAVPARERRADRSAARHPRPSSTGCDRSLRSRRQGRVEGGARRAVAHESPRPRFPQSHRRQRP
jgi:serine/threonine protein kinase